MLSHLVWLLNLLLCSGYFAIPVGRSPPAAASSHSTLFPESSDSTYEPSSSNPQEWPAQYPTLPSSRTQDLLAPFTKSSSSYASMVHPSANVKPPEDYYSTLAHPSVPPTAALQYRYQPAHHFENQPGWQQQTQVPPNLYPEQEEHHHLPYQYHQRNRRRPLDAFDADNDLRTPDLLGSMQYSQDEVSQGRANVLDQQASSASELYNARTEFTLSPIPWQGHQSLTDNTSLTLGISSPALSRSSPHVQDFNLGSSSTSLIPHHHSYQTNMVETSHYPANSPYDNSPGQSSAQQAEQQKSSSDSNKQGDTANSLLYRYRNLIPPYFYELTVEEQMRIVQRFWNIAKATFWTNRKKKNSELTVGSRELTFQAFLRNLTPDRLRELRFGNGQEQVEAVRALLVVPSGYAYIPSIRREEIIDYLKDKHGDQDDRAVRRRFSTFLSNNYYFKEILSSDEADIRQSALDMVPRRNKKVAIRRQSP